VFFFFFFRDCDILINNNKNDNNDTLINNDSNNNNDDDNNDTRIIVIYFANLSPESRHSKGVIGLFGKAERGFLHCFRVPLLSSPTSKKIFRCVLASL